MSGFSLKMSALLLLLTLAFAAKTQNPFKLVKLGDQLFEQGKFYAAEKPYKQALNFDSTNAEILYKYGRNRYKQNEFQSASRYLLKASILSEDGIYNNLSYELAESYRRSGKYLKALRHYQEAIVPYLRSESTYWYKRISQSINATKWAKNHQDKGKYQPIYNFGENVNSRGSDYAATIQKGSLYFTSIDKQRIDEDEEGEADDDKPLFNRIYKVELNENSKKIPLEWDEQDSDIFKDKHLGNLAFGEKREVYFSICDTNYNCNIWSAQLNGNKLINPIKLNNEINQKSTNNTQPYYIKNKGEGRLYFVSNRPGGYGGLDIWRSVKSDNGFTTPVNLGSKINTLGNEITPYYHTETQTLYFSSNWHEGFGGYDIFSAEENKGKFESINNLLQPINGFFNDYYFHIVKNGILFSSNRKEGNVVSDRNCCNDIFTVINKEQKSEKDSVEQEQPKDELAYDNIEDVKVDVELLNKYLPLSLYFHNDRPNPNSRDSTTNKNFLVLAETYSNRELEYLDTLKQTDNNEKEQAAILKFFEEKHQKGVTHLQRFMPLLKKELDKGSKITLTIKGFSSSLSNSDYNYVLALRRIESLINYMKVYQNGLLLPYIQGTAENGGVLHFEKIPYGDFAVKNRSFENKTMAVYGVKAAQQRKIEVIAVNKNDKINGEVSFDQFHHELGTVKKGEKLKHSFKIKNIGEEEVKIYNVNSNCDCADVNYPAKLKGNSEDEITVDINTHSLRGKVTLSLIVVTNTSQNLHELKIDFEVVE